ncbi:MAG: hypothetical protein QJR02_06280 [Sinobacteraceae bacterium]|nr:hypothetical protein [Nevskiaceae bacterium]
MAGFRLRVVSCAALLAAFGALSACGGGNGNTAGTAGSVDTSKSCKQQFNPDKAAAGNDCSPTYGQYCTNTAGTPIINAQTVTACDGVTVNSGSVTAGSLTSNYVVAAPTNAAADSPIYIALHWSEGNGPTLINRMRLTELAKGRGVTVVAPTAPGPVQSWGGTGSLVPTTSVADRVALIDALVTQLTSAGGKAASGRPVIVAGDSGGGEMAFEYACAHADRISGALFVAASITPSDLSSCKPSAPFASVQVHGTNDLVAPYSPTPGLSAGSVETFQALYANNGCDASKIKSATLPPASSDAGISGYQVQWVTGCTSGFGNALVTVQGGGHNWPGFDDALGLPIDIYGPIGEGFDATLQGYDLLRYLGG